MVAVWGCLERGLRRWCAPSAREMLQSGRSWPLNHTHAHIGLCMVCATDACMDSEDATCRRSWTGLKLDCISQKCYFGTVEGMGIFDSKYKDVSPRLWLSV